MPTDLQIVEGLLNAYRQGAFPMAEPETRRIDWFAPDPRALMPLEPEQPPLDVNPVPGGGKRTAPLRSRLVFHIPRSLRRVLRAQPFTLTSDRAFEAVMRGCAESREGRESTWIDERLVHWYTTLHRHGHAHSIEAWNADQQLVGGIYGVSIGAAFFAESMFCRPEHGGSHASKVCLVTMVQHLHARGYDLMDVQFRNPHIDRFGVYTLSRKKYMVLLTAATGREDRWGQLEA